MNPLQKLNEEVAYAAMRLEANDEESAADDLRKALRTLLEAVEVIRILEADLRLNKADHDLRSLQISDGHRAKLMQLGLARALDLLEGEP